MPSCIRTYSCQKFVPGVVPVLCLAWVCTYTLSTLAICNELNILTTVTYCYSFKYQEQMKTRWKSNSWCVYNTSYHIVWCPKYRRKVLVWDVEKRLKELLLEKSTELWIDIHAMEVMPDHVHLFVKSKPIYAPYFIVNQFKWYTSNMLRNEFKHLKSKIPTLRTRSYFIESVWHISESTIVKYIEDQKKV